MARRLSFTPLFRSKTYLIGPITKNKVSCIIDHMKLSQATELILDSPGGDIDEVIRLCNYISKSRFDINIFIDGEVSYESSLILSFNNGKRYITPYSKTIFKKYDNICYHTIINDNYKNLYQSISKYDIKALTPGDLLKLGLVDNILL